ncbi:hypothetical protein KPH14_008292 [Odynerus spinipes]|uniref:Uncharacterized protein n=1 Tax=Odynerus spinipes TaxID=1348599 RepID=A0AAD9RGL5_9HYME|nr:hypothetical protein KPH14_008292 [Odynerus spinipes]
MASRKEERGIVLSKIGIIFLLIGPAVCVENTELVPSNHRNVSATLTLMPESRSTEDQDLKNETVLTTKIDLTTERYSVLHSSSVIKDPRKVKIPLTSSSSGSYHGLRNVKTFSKKDTYLEALEHSHTSKDPKEGVVNVDVKPTRSKFSRREYVQGPVYMPDTEYGAPKEPSTVYGSPNGFGTSSKSPKNSYGPPSSSSFFPKPGDSYSLPHQSSVDFNDHSGYGGPQNSYSPPSSNYGPPQSNYGPPQANYGPPSHAYGAPAYPQQSYGPPGNSYLPHQQGYDNAPADYGTPYGHSSSLIEFPRIDLSWPFALKLNAFTLAKILLKLVLFKMIVKFIAVICLLLFIPKLEIIKQPNKDDAEEEEGRALFKPSTAWERLNLLTEVVMNSVEKYAVQNEAGSQGEARSNTDEDCTSIMCRLRRTFLYKESWQDYVDLFKSYLLDEKETVEPKRR